VPALNDLYLDHADWLGTGVGVAETAVGACLLLGLATRAAAAAGALLALVFWLTVSFGTDPYYFGADLPLLAAAVALALTGPGPLAADGVIAARRRRWRRHLYG
jgi:thiosulfate dehydrogenase [quinone] large subunit